MTIATQAAGISLQRPAIAQLPLPAFATVLAFLLWSSFGPNFDLCIFSLFVLAAGTFLLWRPGESAILIITFALNWIGASTAAFHANWLDVDIENYVFNGAAMRSAVYLSLIGILLLALGIRLGAGKARAFDSLKARLIVSEQPLQQWFKLYAIAWAVSFVTLAFAWEIPGLSQIFLAAASLRWACYFILAYASFVKGSVLNPLFIGAFCLEFALGIGGYFADFRTVFLFTIYTAFASGLKLTLRKQAIAGGLIIIMIATGVVWSEIKTEYRSFVSGGQQQQNVNVSYTQGIGELVALVQDLNGTKLAEGATRLLKRLTYVEFFGLALNYVPQYVAHEDGALLWDAISRPFMPRVFFPDKAIIDDSARTTLYTGGLIQANDGTSISIGYMSEAYIDFGTTGMMFEIFGLGLFYGLVYRYFVRSKNAGPLAGMALASATLFSMGTLEVSITKFIATILLTFVISALLAKYVFARIGWLIGEASAPRG